MSFELKPNEEVLADIGANLFRGIEAVGGRMRITNKRILFEPHSLNLQSMPAEIPLEHIAEVNKRRTLWILPNGILIRTHAGVEYKLVVENREQLIELISKHIHTAMLEGHEAKLLETKDYQDSPVAHFDEQGQTPIQRVFNK